MQDGVRTMQQTELELVGGKLCDLVSRQMSCDTPSAKFSWLALQVLVGKKKKFY